MSLMAVANVLCNSSLQRRFHAEPMVAATERLLHEKAPRMPVLESPQSEPDSVAVASPENAEDAQDNCLSTPKLNTAA